MLTLRLSCLAIAVSLSSCLPAAGQREAVKSKAGDASAAKADPPAHLRSPHGKKGAAGAAAGVTAGKGLSSGEGEAKQPTVYAYGLPTEDGKNLPLSEYKGKVLLIVNLGRQSNFAAQMPALETLSDRFKDKGLVVIGVPSNDFGNAEPGTEAEVAKYYKDAKVNFPVMGVSTLTGVHQLPLFAYLAKNKAVPDDGLHWNFTKFLVDRKGKVIARFSPEVAPDSLEMMATVQEVVDGTWKPKKAPSEKGGDEDEGEEE